MQGASFYAALVGEPAAVLAAGLSVWVWGGDPGWWLLAPLVAAAAARGPFATMAGCAVLLAWAAERGQAVPLLACVVGLSVGQVGAQVWVVVGNRLGAEWLSRVLRMLVGRHVAVSEVDWRRRFERGLTEWRAALGALVRPDRGFDAGAAVGVLGKRAGAFLGAYAAGVLVWIALVGGACVGAASVLVPFAHRALGYAGDAAVFVLLWKMSIALTLALTWTGRQIIKARLTRFLRHEYWPTLLFYLPLFPYLAYLAIRHRSALAFTACNPGIGSGGGVVGESKHAIMRSLASGNGLLLAAAKIEAGGSARERAGAALGAMESMPGIGPFPVILKPDSGFRGFAVRLARTHEDVAAYLGEMTRAAVLQRYHPGPHEVGVTWARVPAGRDASRLTPCGGKIADRAADGRAGFIYSITRKDFPVVTGDGRSTLERLIYAHPRFRCQAPVFLSRFADEASRVPRDGEVVRLAEAGNHCQGTLFRDGADLITSELECAIDGLARSLLQPDGRGGWAEGGLDFGRFDVRFESEEDLRAGRNFGVLELNGTTGESTNLYDPARSLWWSYRVLFGQWRLLYELGAERERAGAKTVGGLELVRSMRAHYRGRPGSAVSD